MKTSLLILLAAVVLLITLPLSVVLILKNPFYPRKVEGAEKFEFVTADKKRLKGLLFKAKQPKATIIFLHGIHGNYSYFIPAAKYFHNKGYNCLLLHLRAHANSDGLFTTYGYYEKNEISDLVLQLQTKTNKPVGLWGTSLGGAVALQTLAINKTTTFGIVECTFNYLDEVVSDYNKRLLAFRSKRFTNYLLTAASNYANFPAFEVNPIESAKLIEQGMFFVHGKKDRKMNPQFSQKNYNAIPHSNKELLWINEANHENIIEIGGEEYFKKIEQFIEKQIKY